MGFLAVCDSTHFSAAPFTGLSPLPASSALCILQPEGLRVAQQLLVTEAGLRKELCFLCDFGFALRAVLNKHKIQAIAILRIRKHE